MISKLYLHEEHWNSMLADILERLFRGSLRHSGWHWWDQQGGVPGHQCSAQPGEILDGPGRAARRFQPD